MKQRLDSLLVLKKIFPSRERARMAIEKGLVKVEGKIVAKAAAQYEENILIEILGQPLKYVSRGGLKLEKAIRAFDLDFKDKRVLDIGASTGGFTDCALQHGAAKVFAVDVGTNQLAASLRGHPSVVNYENLNIKDLPLAYLDNKQVDILVADLSFVSIIPFFSLFKTWLLTEGVAVVLIKPQFEIGEKMRLKKGILKDNTIREKIVQAVIYQAESHGFSCKGIIPTDADGETQNIEHICLLKQIN